MTPQAMLRTPVEARRGAVIQESGCWVYLLVDARPDHVLDALLANKVIGAARRDCFNHILADRVPRPVGPWGALVRLKGHHWTYVLVDHPRYEWPREWARQHNWRVAWFSLDGTWNTKVACLYDGPRECFNFVGGLVNPEPGRLFRKLGFLDAALIGGDDAAVCTQAWLDKLESGGHAMNLLARHADAYLPVTLDKSNYKGNASVSGWDGEPDSADEDEYQPLPDDAFERVDVFTFGGPETLEPSEAALALTAAVRAADAAAVKKAIAEGADPNVMADDDESPLHAALAFGSPHLGGPRFSKVSVERQHALLAALLEGGANPDLPNANPAIHSALHWAKGGDESVILAQLRLLLAHKADPNALGADFFSAGRRPLHVVACADQWPAVLKLLVEHGADANLTDARGLTPRAAAERRVPSWLRLLFPRLRKTIAFLADAE